MDLPWRRPATQAVAHPVIRRFVATEAGEVAALGRWSGAQVTPLRRFPLLVQITEFDLGDVQLLVGRATPLVLLGHAPAESACIMIPLDGRESLLVGGRPALANDVAVFAAGAPLEIAHARDLGWAALLVPRAQVDRLLSPPHHGPIRRAGAAGLLAVRAATWRQAAALVRDAAFVALQDPDIFRLAEPRRALRHALIEVFGDMLEDGPGNKPVPLRRPAPPVLRQLVHAATEMLAARPAEARDTPALAAALGVQEPFLCTAFQSVLGVNAARYLQARRLVLFRAALHEPAHCLAGAGELASRFGFDDRAALPRAYRSLFGEGPPEP